MNKQYLGLFLVENIDKLLANLRKSKDAQIYK